MMTRNGNVVRTFWSAQNVGTILALTVLAGCSSENGAGVPSANARKLSFRVAATNDPLAQFTQQILGDVGQVVSVRAAASDDIEQWRPSVEQIAAMQRADLIFTNGSAAPFAKWLAHVTLPDSRVVQTANDGMKLSEMIAVKDVRIVHSHGPEGEHSHPTMVAHTWLAPAMARKQAQVVADRLAEIYPDKATAIDARSTALQARLGQLQQRFDAISRDEEQPQTVITSTPDLKFFTRALQLADVHLQWFTLPASGEAKRQLLSLKKRNESADSQPRFMLFSREPPPELRTAVESVGLAVVVIDPIETSSNSADYFAIMDRNLERIAPIFAGRSERP